MHLVTGGAGFVGSHLVRALNLRGVTDILVVDELEEEAKLRNLSDCRIVDCLEKRAFFEALEEGRLDRAIGCIYHQGACTDTLQEDRRYLMQNNTALSKLLLRRALERRIPFIYASSAAVYGGSRAFLPVPANERPLNAYGVSKLAFDRHVRSLLPRVEGTLVGLRYFNVYGPREAHKGRMASMVYRVHRQLSESGAVQLFSGNGAYADGEQRRDFVYVEDVVDVNLFFAEGPPRRGIFNVGTGQSRSFNELARMMIALRGRGEIEYIPFPEALWGRYQSFTQADLGSLRAAGYADPFTPLDQGIARSIEAWQSAGLVEQVC